MSTARLTGRRTCSDEADSLPFFDCALAGATAAPNTKTASNMAAKNVDDFLIMITPERPGSIFNVAFKSSYAAGFFAPFKMPGRALWFAFRRGRERRTRLRVDAGGRRREA